jgi:hypothetical protein
MMHTKAADLDVPGSAAGVEYSANAACPLPNTARPRPPLQLNLVGKGRGLCAAAGCCCGAGAARGGRRGAGRAEQGGKGGCQKVDDTGLLLAAAAALEPRGAADEARAAQNKMAAA